MKRMFPFPALPLNAVLPVTGSGSVGDYFTGSFTGTVSQDSVANLVPYPLSGSFRIRITQ